MSISAHDFARPIVVLPDRKAVVRALAAGRTIWCAETGEGFQMASRPTINRARHVARRILAEEERKNFFFGSGVK